jgi:hypothetical protein
LKIKAIMNENNRNRFEIFIDRHPITAVMIVSLIVKLILSTFDIVVNPDGIHYIAAAQQITAGNFDKALQLYPMPAYSLLIATVHFVIPDWAAAARAINIVALVLASIPLYGITRLLFNRKAAFWAIFCLSLTPEANDQALSVLRDPVFLLISLTALLYFLKGISHLNIKNILVASILTGISFLFRIEGIVFLIVPVFYFIYKSIFARDDAFKKFVRRGLLLWIGVPLAVCVILSGVFGPRLLTQNRIAWLMGEASSIANFTAFDKYQEIYLFFQTIETNPPFSKFSKSLPSVIRHWMPLIYTIGLLEYFVKQVFPIFLIPLLWTVQNFFSNRPRNVTEEKQFVLLVWVFYMIFILYSFITRDYIQGRFLFEPAVLLYPWVGYGIILIFKWLMGIKFGQILKIAILIILIVTPCVKIVKATVNSDSGVIEVGRFISEDPQLTEAKILFSDTRQWFYGNRKEDFKTVSQNVLAIGRMIKKGQAKDIEAKAINQGADAIVLFINFNKTNVIPKFEHYRIYNRFQSRKGLTVIYTKKN